MTVGGHDISAFLGVGDPNYALRLKCEEFWSMFHVSSSPSGNTVIDLQHGRKVNDTVHPRICSQSIQCPERCHTSPRWSLASTYHIDAQLLRKFSRNTPALYFLVAVIQ